MSQDPAKTLADAAETVKRIDEMDRKIQPRYQRFYQGLQAGMRHSSEEELRLYRPQMAKVGDEIDACLNTIQNAQVHFVALRQHPDVMDKHFDRIEALVKEVAETRKRLTDQAAAARTLDAEVEAALEKIGKSDVAAEADLGALQAQVKGLMKSIEFVETEAPKLADAARKALGKMDQKAVTAARLKVIEFKRFSTPATLLRARVEKYRKEYPDLDRERKAEVQWMLDDLQKAHDVVVSVDKLVKELMQLELPRPEAKPEKPQRWSAGDAMKVLKAFGLPADDSGKRSKAIKVLEDSPVQQWPKELAKIYGAKEAELKARLGEVRKLPVVKPLVTIDL